MAIEKTPINQTIISSETQIQPEHDDADAEQFVEDERTLVASPRQLMWRRFRKHKMALVSSFILSLLYLIAIFAEFLSPYTPETYDVALTYAPPQNIHFFSDGQYIGPHVFGYTQERNPETLRMEFKIDEEKILPLAFFVEGDPYKMWDLFESDIHLFGLKADVTTADDAEDDADGVARTVFLLGADKLGRDVLTRIFYGARISLSIGLVGVVLSFVLGILIGGISGYYGGTVDTIIQRIIEFIRAVPDIPLWMALSAALPRDWSVIRIYFGITIILSLIGWTFLARTVRGRFLAMREEDFVLAAKLMGVSEIRIILRHMVPSFFSYLIASATLAVPTMILSETSLSFLGLGLRPPAISWGVLLQEAQNLRSVALAPWLLTPGIAVIIAVLALNFVGDGLRDATDPSHG